MTRHISVICAPPHPNPGMYSVDLAFDRWLARSGLDAVAQRYCIGPPHVASGLDHHRLEYASLEESFDEVLSSDLLLYWGDYHHALSYWRTALRMGARRANAAIDEREDIAHLARHLLLAGQPTAVLDKTVSFGTTLIGDDLRASTTTDSAYREALPAFLRGARHLWFRDPVSAAMATRWRGDWGRSHLGVDCAQLLSGDDYRAIAGSPAPAPQAYAGVHFGRIAAPMDQVDRFARALTRAGDVEAVWIPWLGPPDEAHHRRGRSAWSQRAAPGPASYEQLIALVAGARFVITDTYHLCVIAWALGVPAVCVGVGAQRAVRPISDKKKELFHLTLGLSPLYLFQEELADPSSHLPLVKEVLGLLTDPDLVAAVVASVASAADASADRLRAGVMEVWS